MSNPYYGGNGLPQHGGLDPYGASAQSYQQQSQQQQMYHPQQGKFPLCQKMLFPSSKGTLNTIFEH